MFAETTFVHRPVDALEVSMATSMASHDCEGQSKPINGTMLETKIQDKGSNHKFKLLVTFIHALPKMSEHFVFLMLLIYFSNHFLVYASLDDCLLYRMYRRLNMNAFFSF